MREKVPLSEPLPGELSEGLVDNGATRNSKPGRNKRPAAISNNETPTTKRGALAWRVKAIP
jgi:hypothetical protein